METRAPARRCAKEQEGGGGCYAYGICKLGVYHAFGEAKHALDMAGEAIYQRRAREHKASTHLPTYPRAKVYNARLTWFNNPVPRTRHRWAGAPDC